MMLGRKRKPPPCMDAGGEEVHDILKGVTGSKADFINACIIKAAKASNKEESEESGQLLIP